MVKSIQFSIKGQLVIPSRLRREFRIKRGTRAIVYRDGDHITIKPITPQYYRSLRGSLKGKGGMSVLLEERREGREL